MADFPSYLNTDPGCWRNASTHANTPVSVSIWKIRDILALFQCPGAVVSPLQSYPPMIYIQLQLIVPFWNILQCNFCMLAKMSGLDVNRGEPPHGIDTGFDSSSARTRAGLSSCRGCSQVHCLGISGRHVYSVTLGLAMWYRYDPGAQRKGRRDGHMTPRGPKVAARGGMSARLTLHSVWSPSCRT